ncbi:hypothetical protein AYO39_01165 [Actinobacteria bacterium SCGC AG-212-D09]|nr:hypothetical protein AYO39_01165 [Actinobacteria bacterium SCGC AG-212-D09]
MIRPSAIRFSAQNGGVSNCRGLAERTDRERSAIARCVDVGQADDVLVARPASVARKTVERPRGRYMSHRVRRSRAGEKRTSRVEAAEHAFEIARIERRPPRVASA